MKKLRRMKLLNKKTIYQEEKFMGKKIYKVEKYLKHNYMFKK